MTVIHHRSTEQGSTSEQRSQAPALHGILKRVGSVDPTSESVVAEQIEYYRKRAAEYDDWWERRGRYDVGPDFRKMWRSEIGRLRTWAGSLGVAGSVLEVAAGTGIWTARLAALGLEVTALDASPEALRLCRDRVQHGQVRYVVDDVFTWFPDRAYDAIFCGFFLTHVPMNLWAIFWQVMAAALVRDGAFYFIDNAHPEHAFAHGPAEWARAAGFASADEATSAIVRRRRLADGSTYTVVKNYWRASDLERSLRALGWSAEIRHTEFAFMFGRCQRTHA